MEHLFRPRSVAVVGASRDPRSIGYAVVANLLGSGFVGPVYPVNPHARSVHSIPAWPSLAAISDEVDLAVLTVPWDLVLPIVHEAVAKGVKALVTITAGFKEVGAEGAALEAEIHRVLRTNGIRMVGPNCMGLLNTDPEVRLNASFAAHEPPPGTVAFASQSGALGEAILETAKELGLGISSFVSLGNKCDVSGNDLLEWWENDPRTKLILLYLESFGNPRSFATIARRVTRVAGKPILAVKSGRTRRGAEAASSHTGSLAGADAAVDSLLAECGVLRADTVEELFAYAQAFANQPIPAGRRLAILTNAGGPAIMATDVAVELGLDLPEPSEVTRAALAAVLPKEASLRNPVDMIASANGPKFRASVRALLCDPGMDALLIIFVSPATTDAADVARSIALGVEDARATGLRDKPVLICFMGRNRGDEGMAHLRDRGLPVYAFPEAPVRALEAMARFAEFRARPPGVVPTLRPDLDRAALRTIVAAAITRLGPTGGWLTSQEGADLLTAAAIPIVPSKVVETPEEAIAFAEGVGWPVVLKIDSDTLVHKSEHGGVQVDLRTGKEVKGAFWELDRNLSAVPGRHRRVVQAMVQGGTEVLVGASKDSGFGHVLAFGLGGIFVELMKDVVFRVAPVTDLEVERMVRDIRGFPMLAGTRGGKAVDLAAVSDVILRLSALVGECPEIEEIELNPLMAHPTVGQTVAVDWRVRVRAP